MGMVKPMIDNKTLAALTALGCGVTLCGSRVTCSIVSDTSDYDYLVQLPATDTEIINSVIDILIDNNYKLEGGEHYQISIGRTFHSFRKDDMNLLVSTNTVWCERHHVATHVCKQLDILDKSKRIMVFQAILYGNLS